MTLECLEHDPEVCQGAVEYRPTPPFGERALPRCVFHNDRRWERYENSETEKWASMPTAPDWFDPADAGERWDDD